MFPNEMFPPLCIAPAVRLRQAEDAFPKRAYSSLHSSRLFFFFSFLHHKHLLLVLLIFLCNKINFESISGLGLWFFFFLHWAIFSCLLIVSVVPSAVSDNYTVG